ncbi:Hypothetical protein FNO222_1622 [Francisella orientalis]|uniref:Uncharacterized protein n=1 Tax=Francisella orientalis TaxID=299583 RepID=A0ABN4H3J8_9GAMM|nr:hypothetical protein FNO12_1607 [Francisella orientalis FNO12]AKN87677.1 Hypothetical protein FNO24_1609 [Francisella orientalis FNO24]AKN89215.1 Hypothetical protein FNO190_1607 [Francisella orientalis]AKU05974.1 Hypothetical protein FNO01_1607 [Francisella orientalis]QEN20892.1 Hypothetical protein FNO39_1622 [Francisella orientalis]
MLILYLIVHGLYWLGLYIHLLVISNVLNLLIIFR